MIERLHTDRLLLKRLQAIELGDLGGQTARRFNGTAWER